MNLKGLDYNTQRERLVLPEYGREVQDMVDICMSLPTKAQRNSAARTIIDTMARKTLRGGRTTPDQRQKLWEQLAQMSHMELDIDWPVDVSGAQTMAEAPSPMPYPMQKIPLRHYGRLVTEAANILKDMPAGRQRDQLVAQVANQMKRDLVVWGHGDTTDEKVADDLARLTDGKIQLDLGAFRFEKVIVPKEPTTRKRRRK